MSPETCQPYRELFSDLIDGALEGLAPERIQAHLDQCSGCRAEVTLLRGVVTSLTSIGEDEAPPELMAQVMTRVRTEPFWVPLWRLITTPLQWTPVRVLAPAVGLALLFLLLRPHLPIDIRIENGQTVSSQSASAIHPVWWGGAVLVNDRSYSHHDSGRLALNPGDSIRTTDKVRLALTVNGAAVEIRGRTNFIVKTDGLFLTDGKLRVRIEDGKPPSTATPGFKVETPNASVVHLGTIFSVAFDGQRTRTEVFQGKIRVSSKDGRSREMAAGEYASVESHGLLESGPLTDSPSLGRAPRSQPEDVREISPRPKGGSGS
ncbi:MAG: FecR domain-containing protein [Candidatus Riflebacteria bacterium]|nr:FecR domain-containing protein [Candidatus Riflebacteria bacterium]